MKNVAIIVLGALCAALAAAVVFLASRLPQQGAIDPRKSQAILAVNEDALWGPGEKPSREEIDRAVDRLKATLLATAKSERVLEKTALDPPVKQTRWFRDHVQTAVRDLRDRLTAASVPNTNLIVLSMTGADPHELPEIINSWAEAFVEDCAMDAKAGMYEKVRVLEDESSRLKVELAEVEKAVKANGSDPAEVQAGNPTTRGFSPEMEALRARQAQLRRLLDSLEEQRLALRIQMRQCSPVTIRNRPVRPD